MLEINNNLIFLQNINKFGTSPCVNEKDVAASLILCDGVTWFLPYVHKIWLSLAFPASAYFIYG